MKIIPKLLVFGLVEFALFGLMLFVPAGTINYWQAWIFLAVVAVSATLLVAVFGIAGHSFTVHRQFDCGHYNNPPQDFRRFRGQRFCLGRSRPLLSAQFN